MSKQENLSFYENLKFGDICRVKKEFLENKTLYEDEEAIFKVYAAISTILEEENVRSPVQSRILATTAKRRLLLIQIENKDVMTKENKIPLKFGTFLAETEANFIILPLKMLGIDQRLLSIKDIIQEFEFGSTQRRNTFVEHAIDRKNLNLRHMDLSTDIETILKEAHSRHHRCFFNELNLDKNTLQFKMLKDFCIQASMYSEGSCRCRNCGKDLFLFKVFKKIGDDLIGQCQCGREYCLSLATKTTEGHVALVAVLK